MVKGDLSTEKAVLCGLVQNGMEAYIDVRDLIGSGSFTDTYNAIIFSCLSKMFEDNYGYDFPSFLSAANSLNFGETMQDEKQVKYVKSLSNTPVGLENVRKHAVKLSKLAIIRELQSASQKVHQNLNNMTGDESVESILAAAESAIFEATLRLQGKESGDVEKLSDDIVEYLNWLEVNKCDFLGVPSPYQRWNAVTGGGFRRKTVSLFGARPKSSKTTMAKDIGLHTAGKNIPVLLLDTEMDSKDIKNKIIACMSDTEIYLIETGRYADNPITKKRVMQAAQKFDSMPFYYKSISGKKFDDILSMIRRWLFQYVGFDEDGNTNDCLIVYDYFKLQDSDKLKSMQEYQVMGFQVADMTNFAIQYDVPIAAFVQLSRDGIDKETSAAISQSDRLLWLCSSFSILKRKTESEIQEDGLSNGNIKLIPLEARYGPAMKDGDYINLYVNFNTSKIEERSCKSEIGGDDSERIA